MFVALLTQFIVNTFSVSHLIKFFTSFRRSVKIIKCTFILQNNGYCLKLKRYKEEKKVNWPFLISVFTLCLNYIMTQMITKRSNIMYPIFTHKQGPKIQLLILKTEKREVLTSQYQKELFTLNMFPKNKQNKLREMKNDEIK